eukprot:6741036-Pyramimonas_sp.AAC.1
MGNFHFGPPNLAWMLLSAMGIPSHQWAEFLAPTGGNLPMNDDQLSNLKAFIRCQGHLCEQQGLAGAAAAGPRIAANFAGAADADAAWNDGFFFYPTPSAP